MNEYVAGFLFRKTLIPDGRGVDVALIRKNRGPHGMAGKLNGIGGKIEANETPLVAMIREFSEETGATVTDWDSFCTLQGTNYIVHFFRAWDNDDSVVLQDMTDEPVDWYCADYGYDLTVYNTVMPNLKWLIPLALDSTIDNVEVADNTSQ